MKCWRHKQATQYGFTLIELSIVLIIIGLLVGGILVGRDLIDIAAINGQITQINKYQTAAHLFEAKYNYLPGDMPEPYATRYGFQTRGAHPGEGDGNGRLEGNCADSSNGNSGTQAGCGELPVFWQDLSTASLLDITVRTGTNYPNVTTPANWPNTLVSTTPAIKDWIPAAKIGNGNYVYVFNDGHTNFFGLSIVTKIGWQIDNTTNYPGLTVQQASVIDNKIDDGLPQSGDVTVCYLNSQVSGGQAIAYAKGGLNPGANNGTQWNGVTSTACTPTTNATAWAAANCFDNNGSAGTQMYSLAKNASLQNCALSFVFQ